MGKKLRDAVQQILSQENRLDIRTIKVLPPWAILGIDISIISVASFLTIFALRDLNATFYELLTPSQGMFIAVVVNIIFFFVYRTYAGLIRHSSYVDALKIMLA